MVHCYISTAELEDIFEIRDIYRQSFPTPCPDISYWRENIFNGFAHYFVACEESYKREKVHDEAETSHPIWLSILKQEPLILHLIKRLFRKKKHLPASNRKLFGFASIIFLGDEAYLSYLAVRRPCRRCGVGELLLITVLDYVIEHKSEFITCEVHALNEAGRALYKKYGFVQIRRRRLFGELPEREHYVTLIADRITSSTFKKNFKRQKRAYQLKYETGPSV